MMLIEEPVEASELVRRATLHHQPIGPLETFPHTCVATTATSPTHPAPVQPQTRRSQPYAPRLLR